MRSGIGIGRRLPPDDGLSTRWKDRCVATNDPAVVQMWLRAAGRQLQSGTVAPAPARVRGKVLPRGMRRAPDDLANVHQPIANQASFVDADTEVLR